jgi:hypothetical protein
LRSYVYPRSASAIGHRHSLPVLAKKEGVSVPTHGVHPERVLPEGKRIPLKIAKKRGLPRFSALAVF